MSERERRMKNAADLAAKSYDAFMALTPDALKAIYERNDKLDAELAEQQAAWERQRTGASDWQPIETAPKDKWVLIWDPNAECVRVAMWEDSVADFVGANMDWYSDAIDASHWMPLPEPPK